MYRSLFYCVAQGRKIPTDDEKAIFFTGYHSLIACARYAWKHETVCVTFCRRDTAPQTARKAFAGRRRLRASASGLLLRPALRAKRACTRRVAGRSQVLSASFRSASGGSPRCRSSSARICWRLRRAFPGKASAVCGLPLCCAKAVSARVRGSFPLF